jgi:hypothetical protein
MPNDLSVYLRHILDSRYPQSNLYRVSEFLAFLHKRGITITKDELEYYDKKEIIRPVLRLHRQPANEGSNKYSEVNTSMFGLKECLGTGLVTFPANGDFQPWRNYLDNGEEKVMQFYHPFQFVLIRYSTAGNNISVYPSNLEKLDPINFKSILNSLQNHSSRLIAGSYKRSIEFTPKLGLLLLLDEAYGPLVKNMKFQSNATEAYDWNTWREGEFSPKQILERAGMTIEETKELYLDLSNTGYNIDPLANWFPLLQLMKRSAISKLEGTALLSQNYYTLARMVSHFIYEITGEKMLDPDDSSEGSRGKWTTKIYGAPFDYSSRKTRNNILDNYLAVRQFRLILVVEGQTETAIINKLLEVLGICPDRAGLIVHNLEGQQNIRMNLQTIYYLAGKDFIEVFTILDNDQESAEIITKNNIDADRYHKWSRDFEYDNFGTEVVLDYVNLMLKSSGLKELLMEEVVEELSQNNGGLVHIIERLISKKNKIKYLISKRSMCESLMSKRFSEIEFTRKEGKNWEPSLPIERVLRRVLEKFPELSFASSEF